MRRFWTLTAGKARRQFQAVFQKREMAAWAARRRGECLQCGSCCELAAPCPFLTRSRRCRVYFSGIRPRVCLLFPMTEADLHDVRTASGRECGYSFAPPPEATTTRAAPRGS